MSNTESEMLVTPALDACHPDPDHPRHVWPEDLRERVLDGSPLAEVLWEAWRRCLGEGLYRAMRSHDLSPGEALARRRDEGVLDLALQLTLEGLVELATASEKPPPSAQHALRQPISVYDLGGGLYRIVEGERRWWAHVLLRDVLLRAEASIILARVQPLPDDELATLAQRQAEHAHRAGLPAVARARAVKLILQTVIAREVSGTPKKVLGTPGSRNPGGRPRQVEEATAHELHELTGEELRRLTGRSLSGRTVRNYLALLSLPPEAQALAEAANLSERALRSVVSLDDPEAQVILVQALAAGEVTPAQVAAEVKRLKRAKKMWIKEDRAASAVARFRMSLRFAASGDLPDPTCLAGQIAQLPPRESKETLNLARRYITFLQAVLEAGEEISTLDDP